MQMIRGLRLSVALAVAFAGAAVSLPAAADPTLARIDSGAVRGVESAGVVSFKGIPYAAPPVGSLRWRVPQPVSQWDGVLEVKAFGPACMQTDDLPKSKIS